MNKADIKNTAYHIAKIYGNYQFKATALGEVSAQPAYEVLDFKTKDITALSLSLDLRKEVFDGVRLLARLDSTRTEYSYRDAINIGFDETGVITDLRLGLDRRAPRYYLRGLLGTKRLVAKGLYADYTENRLIGETITKFSTLAPAIEKDSFLDKVRLRYRLEWLNKTHANKNILLNKTPNDQTLTHSFMASYHHIPRVMIFDAELRFRNAISNIDSGNYNRIDTRLGLIYLYDFERP